MDGSLDEAGWLWLSGLYLDSTDLDPGPGTFSPPHYSYPGSADLFMVAYDGEGDLAWGGAVHGEGIDWEGDIAVNASGSIYGLGAFTDTCDIDPTLDEQWATTGPGPQLFLFLLSKDQPVGSRIETEEAGMQLFPQPCEDRMSVSFSIPKDGTIQFQLSDMTGSAFMTSASLSLNGMYELDVSAIGPGVYLLRAGDEERVYEKKFVKVR